MDKETKKTNKDPKVVIFGQDIDKSEKKINFKHGSITWGLFFIFVGIIFLLSNFGVLSPIVWSHIFRFWPVIIILIGIDTILGHSDVSEVVSSLLSIFIFLTILGVVFSIFTPHIISGLPAPVLNYFDSIAKLIQR